MRRHGWAVVHGGLGREAEVHGIKAARAWIDGLSTAATAMTRAWASFSYFQFESQNPSLAVSSGDGDGAVWFCARRRQRPWVFRRWKDESTVRILMELHGFWL
ncbi:hypothetical protein M0R45_026364 [Rubus argutus]|uniref:Uncharacterized protein n=1 Tax=Rubus argutus TaxID=59490 RepID=A0AAW1WZ09_RUBAR